MPPPHRQSDMLSFSYADIEPHSSLLIKQKKRPYHRLRVVCMILVDCQIEFCYHPRMRKPIYSTFCLGCLLVISALQVACVDVNAPPESGELPLHVALKKQDTEEVKRLLAAGADPNLTSKDSSMGLSLTPLEVALASGKGEMDCLLALLEAGAKVGEEAVLDAASTRYPQYLRAILDAGGVVPRIEDNQRGTPIWNRLSGYGADSDGKDSVACAEFLMERGISPHNPVYAHHPLHSAAMWGNEDLVRYLLEHGFSANDTDEDGRTPLMGCSEYATIAKMLLEAGADVNAQDKEGRTPLMQMMMREEVVRVLLEAGAKPNMCNNKGETALMFHLLHPDYIGGGHIDENGHYISWSGSQQNIPVIKALIEKGADVNKPNAEGETPLQVVSDGEKEVRALLISAGAKQ